MPVNIKEIRQLIKLMVDNDMTALDVESGSTKVSLKRGHGGAPVVVGQPEISMPAPPPVQDSNAGAADSAEDGIVEIKSPMVGTFYAASSPEGDPFVNVGDAIGPDSVVCIIEAMKVMNEIKAECSGTIVEVCTGNAQPVEFGQALFRVKPS